jgi:hypothetical protein
MSENHIVLYVIVGHRSPIIDMLCIQWNDSYKEIRPFYSSGCLNFVAIFVFELLVHVTPYCTLSCSLMVAKDS